MTAQHSAVLFPMVLIVALVFVPHASAQAVTTFAERARILASRDQLDSACAILDSLISENPGSLMPLLLKSELELNAGDTSSALTTLDQALKVNPASSEARFQLVRIRLSLGDAHAAEKLIEEAPPVFRRSTNTIFLAGEVQQTLGHNDSALTLYHVVYEALAAREFPDPPLSPSQDLSPFALRAVDGSTANWSPGRQTLFLLWSRQSPVSESALAAIPQGIRQAAVTWKFVPINSEPSLSASERTAVAVRAKELGCRDSVWFDEDWQIVRRWSVDRLPCIVLVGYSGTITAAFSGWDTTIKNRLFGAYLAPLGDTVRRPAAVPDSAILQGERMYAFAKELWARGQRSEAIRRLSLAIRNRPHNPLYHVQMASYRWQLGDTAGARLAIDRATDADSTDIWVRIGQAQIALLRNDLARTRQWLAVPVDSSSSAYGQFLALRAFVSILSRDRSQAEADLAICHRMNPFNPYVAVADAWFAEANDPARAATLWHGLLTERMANNR